MSYALPTFQCPEPAEISSATLIGINMLAEEALLADVESYANWLSEMCTGNKPAHTTFGYIPRSDASRTQFIDALDVPQLLALTLHPDQRLSHIAGQALRDRYTKSQVDYLQRLAEKMA